MVQIHSAPPFLLNSIAYKQQNSGRPDGSAPGAQTSRYHYKARRNCRLERGGSSELNSRFSQSQAVQEEVRSSPLR